MQFPGHSRCPLGYCDYVITIAAAKTGVYFLPRGRGCFILRHSLFLFYALDKVNTLRMGEADLRF